MKGALIACYAEKGGQKSQIKRIVEKGLVDSQRPFEQILFLKIRAVFDAIVEIEKMPIGQFKGNDSIGNAGILCSDQCIQA